MPLASLFVAAFDGLFHVIGIDRVFADAAELASLGVFSAGVSLLAAEVVDGVLPTLFLFHVGGGQTEGGGGGATTFATLDFHDGTVEVVGGAVDCVDVTFVNGEAMDFGNAGGGKGTPGEAGLGNCLFTLGNGTAGVGVTAVDAAGEVFVVHLGTGGVVPDCFPGNVTPAFVAGVVGVFCHCCGLV